MMRVLAVIRQVLDAEEKVRITDGKVDLSASKLVMDNMDEYGVEAALRLREAAADVEVIVLAVGPARAEEALRAALAMGADRAILVETVDALDVLAVSAVVAEVARREAAELVFCGGQQADWDSQGLGAAVAERLSWPLAAWTTALTMADGTLTGTHDVDDGAESYTVALPAVVTAQQGLNEPRYPTLPNIMKARKKELRRDDIASFSVSARVKVMHAAVQVKQRLGKVLDGKDAGAAAAELVRLLRDEAKVIA